MLDNRFIDDYEYYKFISVIGYIANVRAPGFAVSHKYGLLTVAEMAFKKKGATGLTCDSAIKIFSDFMDEQIENARPILE